MTVAGAPTIRRARAGDHESIALLLGQVDDLHRQALPWLFRAPDQPPRPADAFADRLADTDSAVLVAEDAHGRVLGVAIGLLRATPAHALVRPARFGLLDVLVVDPAWRGQGLGRALVAAFEDWSRERGAEWFEVKVYAFNDDARRRYESLGYSPLSLQLRKPAPR